jgi:two-component system LytT family sensor kinase
MYATAVSARPEVTWWQGIMSAAVNMTAGALLGIGVWRIAQRTPFNRLSTPRVIATHVAGAVIYAGLWITVEFGWLWLVADAATVRIVAEQAGLWQFMMGVCVYSLIAGISYLILTQKQLRDRERAIAQAEAAAARAQLQSVRAQLNPHFLFNALHGLSVLIRTDPQEADRAVERLGNLLRRSLDHGLCDYIPFGQEWELVRDYVELEQLRLGDRLRVRNAIDPATLDVPVPPLILQPLVENAVKHGVATQTRGGTITVQAMRNNGALELIVSDDGPGAETISGGYGLEGVRKQIEGRYGERGRMSIDTKLGSGFTVRLRIPLEPVG